MAWIEQRRRKFVPHDRIDGQRVKGPGFDTREEARLFLTLVEHIGWTGACDYVLTPADEPENDEHSLTRRERAIAAGAFDDPVALPVTDPLLPPPPYKRESGVSVGELVRRR